MAGVRMLSRHPPWQVCECDQGVYYYNESTKESTWTKPPELAAVTSQQAPAQAEQPQLATPATTQQPVEAQTKPLGEAQTQPQGEATTAPAAAAGSVESATPGAVVPAVATAPAAVVQAAAPTAAPAAPAATANPWLAYGAAAAPLGQAMVPGATPYGIPAYGMPAGYGGMPGMPMPAQALMEQQAQYAAMIAQYAAMASQQAALGAAAGIVGVAGAGYPSTGFIINRLILREKSRMEKNFAEADRIRSELKRVGVDVDDKERTWSTKDGRKGNRPNHMDPQEVE